MKVIDDIVSFMLCVLMIGLTVNNIFVNDDIKFGFLCLFFAIYIIGAMLRVKKLKQLNEHLNKIIKSYESRDKEVKQHS